MYNAFSMSYERNGDYTLGCTYTVGFGLQKKHNTAILCLISAEIVICRPQLLSNLSLLANLSLIIACLSFIAEMNHKSAQLAVYTFGT